MDFKALYAFVVVICCINHADSRRNPHYDENSHCKSTLMVLMNDMARCQGKFFCDFFPGYKAHCIDASHVCDGYGHCKDGSDEDYCPIKPKKCSNHEFKCPGEDKCCTPCNGIHECSMGIDEHKCAPKCKEGDVICKDGGNCATVGDGINDCSDSSDEKCPLCPTCPPKVVCDAGKTWCKRESTHQMECVPLCDGKKDCVGGLDESPVVQCASTTIDCPHLQVPCILINNTVGCAPVCANTRRQCKLFDETRYNECDRIFQRCRRSVILCFKNPFDPELCCGCRMDNTDSNGQRCDDVE